MRADELPITIDYDPAAPFDIASCPNTRGVAVFESGDRKPIQIVAAARLREAVARRLAPPESGEAPTRAADLRPVVRRVRAASVGSSFEADLLFLRLAHTAMPDTFRAVMDRRRGWFVHTDPDEIHPRFIVIPTSAMPAAIPASGQLIGPVADKHAAQRLTQTLEDLFDLCRFHHILVKTPNATACAYKELGKCPAPCDGSEPLADYRDRVRQSIAYTRDPDQHIARIQSQIDDAARDQHFERASALKNKLETAQSITHHKTRHAIGDFRAGWAVITTTATEGQLRAAIIASSGLEEHDPSDTDAIRDASRRLRAAAPTNELNAAILGLVCDTLYRAPKKNQRIVPLSLPDWPDRLASAARDLSRTAHDADDDADTHEAEFTAEPDP